MTRLQLCSVALVTLSLALGACDKNDEKAADSKAADAKASDKKDADDEPAEPAEPAKPEAKHFDVSGDKSGVLARSAAALEATKAGAAIANDDLAEISHHAEKLPSADEVCAHINEVKHEGDQDACVKDMEHHIVKLGPELYALAAGCLMEAKTPAEIDVCVEAEKEAELLLHDKPHGDGVERDKCDAFFAHFEQLAMDDAGPDNAEVVKEILEEVKVDILASCVDQGTQKEIECAMAAEELSAMKACSTIL